MSNRTLLDLSKVQHGTFYYVNQYGQCRNNPHGNSVEKRRIDSMMMAAYHPDYPGETMLERAKRLDILDTWIPVVTFQLTANHNIQFTGDKAIKMWDLWKARIYKKDKK